MNDNGMSIQEAAELWKTDPSTIGKLLREGKIPGAAKVGSRWLIPCDATKPADGRMKKNREEQKDFFRFPLFVNAPEKSFVPPLSKEEAELREAQLAFLDCDFQKAKQALNKLIQSAENMRIRIMALFIQCDLSAAFEDGKDFDSCYNQLVLAFAEDFPHKKEMEFMFPWLFYQMVLYKNGADHFHLEAGYEYDPSADPIISVVTLYNKVCTNFPEVTDCCLDIYETQARMLERAGSLYEAQQVHLTLFILYYIKANEKIMTYHLKKVLDIACRCRFIFPAADAYPYYPEVFDRVLDAYPSEFAERIRQYGPQIGKSFARFMKNQCVTDLYLSLAKEDYPYIFYAARGYSFKDVSKILHKCERTVASRYLAIYEKLGVKTKYEMLALLNGAIEKKQEPEETQPRINL